MFIVYYGFSDDWDNRGARPTSAIEVINGEKQDNRIAMIEKMIISRRSSACDWMIPPNTYEMN